MKYLLIASVFIFFGAMLTSCGTETEAGGRDIADIGFETYSIDGTRSESVSCNGSSVAISSGCDCNLGVINSQYIEYNTAHCICDRGTDMTVLVVCANLKY